LTHPAGLHRGELDPAGSYGSQRKLTVVFGASAYENDRPSQATENLIVRDDVLYAITA
jgi:hypothetical protein